MRSALLRREGLYTSSISELTSARIIIWSSATPEELERARTLGADESLRGPTIEPDRLLAAINDSIG